MARTISIGNQDFETIRQHNYFYIDKTHFIKEWWESGDIVTLITRPRRFGKTLNMSMLEQFFSIKYANRSDLFAGLRIWENNRYHKLQGTWPVIMLSFADVKESSFDQARKKICRIIKETYKQHSFLLESGLLDAEEKDDFKKISVTMEDNEAAFSLKALAGYLMRYYGKKAVILLDEYDTPMQEAYVHGYWEEMTAFIRSLFNSTFKTNPYLERAVMTGITRVSKESVFSDLNNLEAVTTTSEKYMDCFGFTEDEVFAALGEYGLADRKQQIKDWYDGFTFGTKTEIYNPWSIISFLDKKKIGVYWANTSANSLIGKLVREGSADFKKAFEHLLQKESILVEIDEQIVYNQLAARENAIWSLMLASGYLKVTNLSQHLTDYGEWEEIYELKLTNLEIRITFRNIVAGWFDNGSSCYNDFTRALLIGDLKAMNTYMNKITLETFSFFDARKKPSEEGSERFYHGFVLGLIVGLADKYIITSNRESGFGRYDIIVEPRSQDHDGIIIEFKIQKGEEKGLSDTVQNALKQIEEKNYQADLLARGIPQNRIRKYGFAFCGKKVLIGGGF